MSPAMTPRSETRLSNADRKGKAIAFSEDHPVNSTLPPPPPIGTLTGEGFSRGQTDDYTDMGDWRRFREVGLLDEASMERKDREALLEKISTLEKEVPLMESSLIVFVII